MNYDMNVTFAIIEVVTATFFMKNEKEIIPQEFHDTIIA